MNNILPIVAAGAARGREAAPLALRMLHVPHRVAARLEGGLAAVGLSLAKFRVLEQLAGRWARSRSAAPACGRT